MQNQAKHISFLMDIEAVTIISLFVVTGWCAYNNMEIEHTALLRNSASKLARQVKDAKLLLDTYSTSHMPVLKEWCNAAGQDLSLEINSPWWQKDKPMFASDEPDQWKKMIQLSASVTGAMANPDAISGKAELASKLDALETVIKAILNREADAWEACFRLKPDLILVQWILQIVVLVVFSLVARAVKTLIKSQNGGGNV